ncbi:Zinc fingerC2H2 type family protein [Aphelenchoides avenae]|nr:Zinc fingerC2H2 type family protein [Aphelenchus avenae]
MKLHGSRKQYACDQCDFSCTNKKTMRHHKKLHKWHSSPKKSKQADDHKDETGADQIPSTTNVKAHSPFSQEELQPQMRAIDIALKLTPDEDGQRAETMENSTEAAEQMPVLVAESQPVKPSPQPLEDFLNDNTLEKEDDEDDEAETSGAQFHPRNTVQCPFCPFRTRSGERLRPHVAGHSRASGFLCSFCTFKHEAAGLLRRHILRIHRAKNFPWPPTYVTDGPQQVMTERPKRIRTPVPKRASAPPELRRARIKKPQPSATLLKCTEEGCKYTTEHKNELMRHRLRHENSKKTAHKVRRLACPTCGLRVSNYGRLRVHRLLKHRVIHNRELYQSLLCEALGKSKPRMRRKSAKQEEEQKANRDLFKCTKCPYICDQKLVLERHETKHMVKAENQCPNCTFSCRSVTFLEQHMRVHIASPSTSKNATPDRSSTPQLFSCHHCPYKSRHRCDMKAHLKMHEADNPYKCPHCTYSSQRQSALSMHEKLHESGDRGAKATASQQKESGENDVEDTELAEVRARDGRVIGRKVRRGDRVLYRCEACSTTAKLANEFYKHVR